VPVLSAVPTAPSGMGFAGYFDAATNGTMYIDPYGAGVKEIAGAMTLYAQYSAAAVLDVTGTTLYGISPTANASAVTEVTVPSTVTEIADGAFENNTSLTEVNFEGAQTLSYAGSSLKRIGASAFKGCTGLTELVIPNSVKTIGTGAFQNLSNVEVLRLPSAVNELPGVKTENAPLFGLSSLKVLECNAEVIPSGKDYGTTYGNVSGLTHLFAYVETVYDGGEAIPVMRGEFPSTLTTINLNGGRFINSYAFGHNPDEEINIETLTLPTTLREIYSNAFYGNSYLTELDIPNGVTKIGTSAFESCYLKRVTLPNTLKTIETMAFYDTQISSIIIPESVTEMGSSVFYLGGLKKVEFSLTFNLSSAKGVFGNFIEEVVIKGGTSIPSSAFEDCAYLTTVSLPDTITSIGSYAFCGCSKLTSITIPDGVTSIGAWAFYECTSITNLNIPKNITTISDGVFSSCSSLTSITIPNGVTSLGEEAFSYCRSLISIAIPKSVKNIGILAFSGCDSLVQVKNLSGISLSDYGYMAPSYAEVLTTDTNFETTLEFGEKYTIFIGKDGIKRLLSANKNITSANDIPNDINVIEKYAFENCSSLTSVTIPSSVTSIGNSAFYKCSSLTTVTIPDTVNSIGDGAFSYCSSLESVVIGSNVSRIGTRAFANCASLTSATFKNPNGWRSFEEISATVLSNPTTAVSYLKSESYNQYAWTRSAN